MEKRRTPKQTKLKKFDSTERIKLIKRKIVEAMKKYEFDENDYKIELKIKKKTWKKKLRLLRIKIIFIIRLKNLWKRAQYYGVSTININPNFRSIKKIKKKLEPSKKTILNFNIIKRKKYLFYPNDLISIISNFLNLIFIFYLIVFIPVFFVFEYENIFWKILDRIMDIFFIIDIFINFNTTYIIIDNKYELSRKKIAIKYLKSYFFIDLLSSIPISIILDIYQISNNSSNNKMLKFILLPKLIRTLKITKIFKLSNKLNSLKLSGYWRFKLKIHENFFKTLYIAGITYLVLHLAACVFIAIGKISYFENETWIYKENLINESDSQIYFNSVYYCFVVLTTVGYGDIVSVNTFERLFTLIWMLFGIAFYSFTISFITRFFTSKETRKYLLAKKVKEIEKFAKDKNVKDNLLDNILNSIDYSSKVISYRWLEGKMNIIRNMGQELKYDFFREFHKDLLKCPFFDTKDPTFAVRIISLLKPIFIKKGEFLWKKEDNANYVCFVTKGKLFLMMDNLLLGKKENEDFIGIKKSVLRQRLTQEFWKNKIRYLKKNKKKTQNNNFGAQNIEQLIACKLFAFKIFGIGTYIGEEEILSKKKREYYLKAATDVELMALSSEDFEKVFKTEFPYIYNRIKKKCIKRKENVENSKKNLLKDIVKLCNRNKIHVLNNYNPILKNTLDLLNKKKLTNMQNLRDFYENSIIPNPLNGIYKDIKIEKYNSEEMIDDEIKEDNEFYEISTPGLDKMFLDWKVLNFNNTDYINKENFPSLRKDRRGIRKTVLKGKEDILNNGSLDRLDGNIRKAFRNLGDNVDNVEQFIGIVRKSKE